jgi:hypothetical protein
VPQAAQAACGTLREVLVADRHRGGSTNFGNPPPANA